VPIAIPGMSTEINAEIGSWTGASPWTIQADATGGIRI
jgi:hypothetical protein